MKKLKKVIAITIVISMLCTFNVGTAFAAEAMTDSYVVSSKTDAENLINTNFNNINTNLWKFYEEDVSKVVGTLGPCAFYKLFCFQQSDCKLEIANIRDRVYNEVGNLDYSYGQVDISDKVNEMRNGITTVVKRLRDDQKNLATAIDKKYKELDEIDLNVYQDDVSIFGRLYSLAGNSMRYSDDYYTTNDVAEWMVINARAFLDDYVNIKQDQAYNNKLIAELDNLYKPAEGGQDAKGTLYTGGKLTIAGMECPEFFKFIPYNGITLKGLRSLKTGNSVEIPYNSGETGVYDITTGSFTVSSGIFDRAYYSMKNGKTVNKVVIEDNVEGINVNGFRRSFPNLKNIEVSAGNNKFSSENDILYNKDKSKVIYCPNDYVGKVTLPETVLTIGKEAFKGCKGVTEITNLNIVTEIEERAFEDSGLEKADLNSNIRTINYSVFSGCQNLNNINLENIDVIKEHAFSKCSGLEYVKLNKNTRAINYDAFNGCKNLSNINLEAAEFIDGRAFTDCERLEVVELNKSIRKICYAAFSGCTNLKTINIPEGLKTIANDAFIGDINLTTINLPNSINGIGSFAFYNCNQLNNIELPKDINKIKYGTFENCKSLKTLTIPKSVNYIHPTSFSGCDNLTLRVYKDSDAEKYAKEYRLNYTVIDEGSSGGGGNPGGGGAGGGGGFPAGGGGGGAMPPAVNTEIKGTVVNGNADINADNETVKNIVDAAVKEKKPVAEVDVKLDETAKNINVKVDKDTLKNVIENNLELKFNTPNGVVTLDKASISELYATEGAYATISIGKAEADSKLAEKLPGGFEAFDVSITSGDAAYVPAEGNKSAIRVPLPYTIAYKDLAAFCVVENGKPVMVEGKIVTANGRRMFELEYEKPVEIIVGLKTEVEKIVEEYAAKQTKITIGVKDTNVKAKSSVKGRKVTITWKKTPGYKMDGYEVYRSTKKNYGYGKKPIFVAKGTKYTNTKGLKSGRRYYYKVRGFRMVDGKKVYSEWSNKVSRTVK